MQYAKRKEWTYEGERTRVFTQVAIDGNCARTKAERMLVRVKRALKANSGGTAVIRNYRPEEWNIPLLGIFIWRQDMQEQQVFRWRGEF